MENCRDFSFSSVLFIAAHRLKGRYPKVPLFSFLHGGIILAFGSHNNLITEGCGNIIKNGWNVKDMNFLGGLSRVLSWFACDERWMIGSKLQLNATVLYSSI